MATGGNKTRKLEFLIGEALAQNGYRAGYEKVAKMGGDDLRSWYHCSEPISMSNCIGMEKWIEGRWANWSALTQMFLFAAE